MKIKFVGPSNYYKKRAWFFSYHKQWWHVFDCYECRLTILGIEFWWTEDKENA